MAEIYELGTLGKMLEAIQTHRQMFNLSLADEKNAVENLRGQIK